VSALRDLPADSHIRRAGYARLAKSVAAADAEVLSWSRVVVDSSARPGDYAYQRLAEAVAAQRAEREALTTFLIAWEPPPDANP
jgi:hypothetical protein